MPGVPLRDRELYFEDSGSGELIVLLPGLIAEILRRLMRPR